MSNKLTDMIDGLVLEKTMSLDALNAINALKAQAVMMEHQLKESDAREERSKKSIELLKADLSEQRAHNLKLTETIAALDRKIVSIEKAEREGHEAKAELKGFTAAMQMVFRPSVVRETIQKQVPVPVAGGGTYSGFVDVRTESGTVERSAE